MASGLHGLRRVIASGLSLALAACAGNERPPSYGHAGPDASISLFSDTPRVIDAIPLREVNTSCGGTAMSLTRRSATVLLVVDRSGSMADLTIEGVQKWQALLGALNMVLPRVEANLRVGLVVFPAQLPSGTVNPTAMQVCHVAQDITVQPALNNATRILTTLVAQPPVGATPTHAGIAAAERWFMTDPDRDGARYILLATDGGPNCNLASALPCRCTSSNSALCTDSANMFARLNCLDENPPVEAIGRLNQSGIPTYVLGLAGVESFTDVLNRMADAGGRARTGATRYYNVATSADLTREFTTITSGLIECRFRLNAPPPDPTLVDVRLDGRSLIHDVMRRDGWDWSDDSHTEILFYGDTCDDIRAATGGSQLVAAFGCPAPVPP